MSDDASGVAEAVAPAPARALLVTLAAASAALVANIYYAQPLVSAIAPGIGVDPSLAGSIVSLTQVGYGLGLFFLVSLSDLVDSKRLVLVLLALTTVALLGASAATSAPVFFAASLMIGVCSTGAQILLPFAAHLAPIERRGRVVGNIMAGVLTGIMLARPLALFIASAFGWRAVFLWSAGLMVAIAIGLCLTMPRAAPRNDMHYGQILVSMARLARERPPVLWRSAYQALMFGAFNLFWTAVPLELAARFGLDQRAIALFALAGAGGAFAAPIAGRLADRGLGTMATGAAMTALGLSFIGTMVAAGAGLLILLAVFAIAIDAAVQVNQIVSQRIIFAVPIAIRGRVNAVYMTISFLGGALGSMLSTLTYHAGGWSLTAAAGAAVGAAALGLQAIEMLGRPREASR